MKKMKKLSAVLLSLVIIAAMCATAFTASAEETVPTTTPNFYSITINNAVVGETYTAYKLFDLTVENPGNPKAYAYTVNEAWKNNDSTVESSKDNDIRLTDEFKAVFAIDDKQYVTAKNGINSESTWTNSALSAFASKAAAFAKTNNISYAAQVIAVNDKVIIDTTDTGAGYYIIASSLGTRVMADTTPSNPAVTIVEKNATNSLSKAVKESSGKYLTENSAQIGDTIEYKTDVTIVARSVGVKIHDIMDDGLTLDKDSIKVYTSYAGPSTNTEYSDAANPLTIRTINADEGDDFTIDIPDGFAANATTDQELFVIYTAKLNQNAVRQNADGSISLVDQVNRAKLTYGGAQSIESITTTKTNNAQIFKHVKGDTTKALGGAVFQLTRKTVDEEGNTFYPVINLKKLDEKNYRVVDATEAPTKAEPALSHMNDENPDGKKHITVDAGNIVSDFVTVNSKDGETDSDIYIWGLDGDSNYSIVEILAPDGYNKLSDPQPLIWKPADSTVDNINGSFDRTLVINDTGLELPSTGGIGATVFYIAGGVFVLGAAVIFVVRRRMKKDEAA